MLNNYAYQHYDPSQVVAKYIGFIGEELNMFEVNSKNQTVKSFPINSEQVDPAHAAKALAQKAMRFNQVKVWEK